MSVLLCWMILKKFLFLTFFSFFFVCECLLAKVVRVVAVVVVNIVANCVVNAAANVEID